MPPTHPSYYNRDRRRRRMRATSIASIILSFCAGEGNAFDTPTHDVPGGLDMRMRMRVGGSHQSPTFTNTGPSGHRKSPSAPSSQRSDVSFIRPRTKIRQILQRTGPLCAQSSSPSSSSSNNVGRASTSTTTQNIRGYDLEFELHSSISSISAEEWDSFLAPDGSSSPFMEHAWLRCLECAGCASPSTGWVPQHLSVRIGGVPSVYVPLYIKGHSQGEFIFDAGWAEAAYQNGIQYYPKLLVGVPFTPATGERILLHPDIRKNWPRKEIAELRVVVGKFLRQIALSNKLSSIHLNFILDEEAEDIAGFMADPSKPKKKQAAGAPEGGSRRTPPAPLSSSPKLEEADTRNNKKRLEKKNLKDPRLESTVQSMLDMLTYKNDSDDYLRRTSMQYHWLNRNAKKAGKPYESFDDYLDAFKSKRRITIRRERKRVIDDENIRIDAVVGSEILQCEGLVDQIYKIYISTVNKNVFGKQYLTLEFFQMLAESDFCRNLCFMCVRPRDSGDVVVAEDIFAGTFNIIQNGVFYGRYWGCLPGREIKNLHFETCYWTAIEYCIENGLAKMEPGAGGGDYKWARGFDPALIHSAHYICHPGLRRAVQRFLDYETENNVEVSEFLLANSAVGSETTKPSISKMKKVQAHARVDLRDGKRKDTETPDAIDANGNND